MVEFNDNVEKYELEKLNNESTPNSEPVKRVN